MLSTQTKAITINWSQLFLFISSTRLYYISIRLRPPS